MPLLRPASPPHPDLQDHSEAARFRAPPVPTAPFPAVPAVVPSVRPVPPSPDIKLRSPTRADTEAKEQAAESPDDLWPHMVGPGRNMDLIVDSLELHAKVDLNSDGTIGGEPVVQPTRTAAAYFGGDQEREEEEGEEEGEEEVTEEE
eukprot:1851798-Prymnesium_polylepis.1